LPKGILTPSFIEIALAVMKRALLLMLTDDDDNGHHVIADSSPLVIFTTNIPGNYPDGIKTKAIVVVLGFKAGDDIQD
jgi:hypothetical protein